MIAIPLLGLLLIGMAISGFNPLTLFQPPTIAKYDGLLLGISDDKKLEWVIVGENNTWPRNIFFEIYTHRIAAELLSKERALELGFLQSAVYLKLERNLLEVKGSTPISIDIKGSLIGISKSPNGPFLYCGKSTFKEFEAQFGKPKGWEREKHTMRFQ
jgi:hypothetical protein